MYTLYRDDDISVTSNITLLMKVHELFIKHNRIHTVAVLMKDLWENKEVWYWLQTAPNLEIGLHGWDHQDYGKLDKVSLWSLLTASLEYWQIRTLRGGYKLRPITTFYPPWNSVSQDLMRVCNSFGLTVDSRVGGEVYNFHYWALFEDRRMKELEEALRQ